MGKGSRKGDTRERILEAARDLFLTFGFEGTGVRQIGRASGLTDAALYHHFPSKRAIYEAIFVRHRVVEFDQASSFESSDIVERVLALRRVPNPETTSLMLVEALRGDPAATALARTTMERFMRSLAETLAPAYGEGAPLLADAVTMVLLGAAADARFRLGDGCRDELRSPAYEERLRRLLLTMVERYPPAATAAPDRRPASAPAPCPPPAAATGRRDEILDAALRVFGERGYDSATMKLVAQACGISDAAIYHHFASKQALFAAVLTERDRSTKPRRGTRRGRPAEAPPALVRSCILAVTEQEDRFRLIVSESAQWPEAREAWAALAERWQEHFAANLAGQVLAPEVESVARGLFWLAVALVFRSFIEGGQGFREAARGAVIARRAAELADVVAPRPQNEPAPAT